VISDTSRRKLLFKTYDLLLACGFVKQITGNENNILKIERRENEKKNGYQKKWYY
jgi:hypothetical protein